jgi:hypothetical protein
MSGHDAKCYFEIVFCPDITPVNAVFEKAGNGFYDLCPVPDFGSERARHGIYFIVFFPEISQRS